MGWGLIMQGLSGLCGLVWVSGILCVNAVLLPSLITAPLEQLRTIGNRIASLINHVLIPAAALMLVLGVLRGLLFGPMHKGITLFDSASEITLLLAFLATGGSVVWGMMMGGRATKRLHINSLEYPILARGRISAISAAQLQRMKLLSWLELLSFFASSASFICLLLMSVGLS